MLALLPLALGAAEGSELQAPLARTVVGGLTTSTLVTLLLVPAAYLLVERRRSPEHTTVPGPNLAGDEEGGVLTHGSSHAR